MIFTSNKIVQQPSPIPTTPQQQHQQLQQLPVCSSSGSSTKSLSSSASGSSLLLNNRSKNDSVLNTKQLNSFLNMKKSKFEFKPSYTSVKSSETIGFSNSGRSMSMFKNQIMRNSNLNSSETNNRFLASNENVNNWLHGTYKGKDGSNGKITKTFRADSKNNTLKKLNKSHILNSEVLESFNLTEKEKFRQLISQNINKKSLNTASDLHQATVNSTFNSSSLTQNKNLYQKYIHSSPTQIRDDNNLHSSHEISSIFSSNIPSKIVSRKYSRRISLSSENSSNQGEIITSVKQATHLSTLNHKPTNTTNVPVIELDSSQNPTPAKVAKKRPTSSHLPQSNSYFDENNDLVSINPIENLKYETKQYFSHLNLNSANFSFPFNRNLLSSKDKNNKNTSISFTSSNGQINEKQKKWNEKLKDSSLIQDLLKKPSNTALVEERYLHKKIQRIEKERIEKELAEKFSLQLHLDANRLSIFEKELETEIDEFPEFTEEQEIGISNALNPHPQTEVLVSGFGLEITRRDIQTLKGLNWLNDEIINFYMNLICERSNNSVNTTSQNSYASDIKVYAFSTFFYPKLLKDGYNSLRRWTKKVDLFSYNLVLIPIHLGLHWTLAVIDFDCNEIRYYDSMNNNNSECLKALRNYLKDEYADKKSGAQLDLNAWNCVHVKDVPQQMNGSDCGMFACKYAEFISRGKAISFNQSHMSYYRRRMVWEITNKKLMQ